MKIGNFTIDDKSPVFIIAELSANHNGSIEVALETIKAAKRAGATPNPLAALARRGGAGDPAGMGAVAGAGRTTQ